MVGVFDSGSGGLTVARAIRARAPKIDIVYFGDVANAPYGSRPYGELQSLTIQGMAQLRALGAQNIVSACNSISAKVIRPMAQLLGSNNSAIVEMVGPAAIAAAMMEEATWVGLATPATVESGMYQDTFRALGLDIEMISCPSLAGAIEFDEGEDVLSEKIIRAVEEVAKKGADRVLLGCTHYPLVRQRIEEELERQGSNAKVFDPADAVACEVITRFGSEGSGKTIIATSKHTDAFSKKVTDIFGAGSYEYRVIEPLDGMAHLK